MATAAAAVSDEVTDYSDGARLIETPEPEAIVIGGDEPEIVGGEDRSVIIRINTDLDDVTIGAGNNYNFKEGERYRVPVHVATHLEEKGYVWH